MLSWIRKAEQWIIDKTYEHPAWNALTWAGHAALVTLVGGAAGMLAMPVDVLSNILPGVPTALAPELSALGVTTAAGYYFWRELVELYRGQHIEASAVWIWVDHAMDVAAPVAAALLLF